MVIYTTSKRSLGGIVLETLFTHPGRATQSLAGIRMMGYFYIVMIMIATEYPIS